MESNICKGTKNDFSYFVDMALQNRMPWKTLASLLKDLAPTLNETWEIVRILLQELEAMKSTLQKKDELLEKYQTESDTFEEIEQNFSEEIDDNLLKTEAINDESVVEPEMIDDGNEVLKDFEDIPNEELYLELNEGTESSADISEHEDDVIEIDEHDSDNEIANISLNEPDNLQFVSVTNDKTSDSSSEKKLNRTNFKMIKEWWLQHPSILLNLRR